MKKIYVSALLAMMAGGAMAQETYESAQLATQGLNGTARYIGMGGALEALGADISTMHSNPAGIGMMRRSWIGVSGGATIQAGDKYAGYDFGKSGVTNADLNQIGVVYTSQTDVDSYWNFGFDFKKSTNFNEIMTAVNSLHNASISKKSAIGKTQEHYNFTDYLVNEAMNVQFSTLDYNGYAESSNFAEYTKRSGYIGEYGFSFSGNLHNRVFLGLGFGLKSVHYDNVTDYSEVVLDNDERMQGEISTYDDRRITGSGFDIKFGAIFRPVEDSPFRIGLYVNSPTWYRLTCDDSQGATFSVNPNNRIDVETGNVLFDRSQRGGESWIYNLNTPWKFGVSLGHTIEDYLAIGATYQFTDYSSIDNRIATTDYREVFDGFVWYDEEYRSSSSDMVMNRNTEKMLKGSHLLKVGAEIKPVPDVAIRLGYNYESSMYEDKGYKETTLNCDGSYIASNAFVNWGDTHRVTFGLGFKLSDDVNLDLAYQYSTIKGKYYPFESQTLTFDTEKFENFANPTDVKNDRHQISCTLGCRF